MNKPTAPEPPVDLATESVAGEEDPGASLELAVPPAPGTGENVCPLCAGSGKLASGTCLQCQGKGKLAVGTGAA